MQATDGSQSGNSPQKSSCVWQLENTSEILSTNDGAPGMSVQRGDDWQITTSYTFSGNQGCPEQTVKTTHGWVELGDKLITDQTIPLKVEVGFELQGSAECAAISLGFGTYLALPDHPIIKVVVEKQDLTIPYGTYSQTELWTVIPGVPGETMTIKGTALSGSLGGSVFYNYICQSTETP